jgi:hypothetical protein
MFVLEARLFWEWSASVGKPLDLQRRGFQPKQKLIFNPVSTPLEGSGASGLVLIGARVLCHFDA